MSHALGKVRFQDGEIMYFEYNGTCDYVISALWKTSEEVGKNWRKNIDRKCMCSNSEKIEIATDYGRGTTWKGTACRECMCVTSGFEYNYANSEDGLPNWWRSDENI